jgi:hypothetical protein
LNGLLDNRLHEGTLTITKQEWLMFTPVDRPRFG